MGIFLVLLACVVVIAFFIGVAQQTQAITTARTGAEQRLSAMRQSFKARSDLTFSHRWYGVDCCTAIALDEQAGTICLADAASGPIHSAVIRSRDLIDVSLIEDGSTITETRTSRGSQVASALVGGVLLGPAGLVVGGLSGKKTATSTPTVSSIELRLTVNDTQRPLWRIMFLNVPVPKSHPSYRTQRDQGLQWQALLAVLIRRGDQETNFALQAPNSQPQLTDGGPVFHVSRCGVEVGEMSTARIRTLLASGHLAETDYYFDQQLNEWLTLSLLP